MGTATQCPHLRRVVMMYCDACELKKPVPEGQLCGGGPCCSEQFVTCALFREQETRLESAAPGGPAGPTTEER